LADIKFPGYAIYGATKTFNLIFADLVITQFQKSLTSKGLIDGLILQPSAVTSGMNQY